MNNIIIKQIVKELCNPTFSWMKLEKDKFNNDMNVLLMKSILGALRPWWQEAYDTCLNGDDFNVPELHPDWSASPLRGFEEKHHELLTEFATAIADELGYVNADFEEEREWDRKREQEKMNKVLDELQPTLDELEDNLTGGK